MPIVTILCCVHTKFAHKVELMLSVLITKLIIITMIIITKEQGETFGSGRYVQHRLW